MTRSIISAIAISTAFLATGANAQTTAQTTVHADPVTLQQWGRRVGDELSRRVHYPAFIGGQPFATGIVRVKFNCSDSGRPDKVELLKGSRSGALDRAALAAVRRIATLDPLPDGMSHDQPFQAVLIFEADQDRYDVLARKVRDDALKSNAWFKGQSLAGAQLRPIMVASR